MAERYDYTFVDGGQQDTAFQLTLDMSVAAPAIANRIFPSLLNVQNFLADPWTTAVPGVIVRVIEDEDSSKNIAYMVKKDSSGNLYPEPICKDSGLTWEIID